MFLLVGNYLIDLLPNEILMVRPKISHAVVEIEAIKIKHVGFRAPFRDDKVKLGKVPVNLPKLFFLMDREIRHIGFVRIPLNELEFQNWWIFGFGSAIIQTQYIIWGLMDINDESQYRVLNYDEEYHSHKESWEYYGVIFGTDILEIEGTEVRAQAGEIVEVPPSICHKIKGLEYPFRGFTLRVPIKDTDKSLCHSFTE